MIAVLCSYCFSVVDNFEDLDFDEGAYAYHMDCPHIAQFETDLEQDWDE